jgi:hypothetical protein
VLGGSWIFKELLVPAFGNKSESKNHQFQVFQKNLKRTGWVYQFFVGSLTSSFSQVRARGRSLKF